MSSKKGRCAVLIVELPEGYRPDRPHTLPERFLAGELFAKNLGLCHVLGFVNTFNKHQLAIDLVDRRWAVAVRRGHMFWGGPHADGDGRPQTISREMTRAAVAAAVAPLSADIAGDEDEDPEPGLSTPDSGLSTPADAELEITLAHVLVEGCS